MRLAVWKRSRQQVIDEAAAYARCHGGRSGQILAVRQTSPPPVERPAPVARPRRGQGRVTGEQLRRRFEELLDSRPRS